MNIDLTKMEQEVLKSLVEEQLNKLLKINHLKNLECPITLNFLETLINKLKTKGEMKMENKEQKRMENEMEKYMDSLQEDKDFVNALGEDKITELSFEDYQRCANHTAIYPNKGSNLYYPALGLGGETGEVLEKIKKIMRDKNGGWDDHDREEIKKELGDVLWYVNALCHELHLTLEEVAEENLMKLYRRMERNKIHGNGDNR